MEAMKEDVSFRHFSHHHHPLIFTPKSSQARNIACCSGCNLSILPGKDFYHCKICNFSLHRICYDLPRKTRHPGHPYHFLNLLVMPSSSAKKSNLNCKACGQNVTGFYYNCGQCGFCYHILCSALPLSVSINSHSHSMKLEFSLPYDFECDLCYKPCYSGWLYRCRLCEFDTHLACAIVDQRAQSLLEHQSITNPLFMSSSASRTEPSRKTTIDYGSESNNELMQLVAQGIARGIMQETTNVVAVTGWNEKLYSPREKLNLRNGMIEFSGTIQTKKDMAAAISPIPGGNSELVVDQWSSTSSSCQFSDLYFSIDLTKSYSSYDQPNGENITDASCRHNGSVVQDVKEKKIISYKNNYLLDRIAENLEPATDQELSRPSFGFRYGPEYRINEAFLNKGSKQKVKKRNETRDTSSIKNQSSVSDSERTKGSCWWELLHQCCCCCYYPKYERETIFTQA